MKPYNESLNRDVTSLKILHSKKDKTEFNLLKAEIMKRHNISKATIYREMKKQTPGLYDRKRSDRPVTAQESAMVSELLVQQHKVQAIITIMERKTGMPYSWDRIDRIRGLVESYKVEGYKVEEHTPAFGHPSQEGNANLVPLEKGDLGGLEIKSEHTPSFLPVPQAGGHPSQEGNNESAFGGGLREFLDELFEADKIADGMYLTVNIAGKPYRLSRQIAEDITLIITNYAESFISAMVLKYPEQQKLQLRDYISFQPGTPLEELIENQTRLLRECYTSDELLQEPKPVRKEDELIEPDTMTGLNRIRIFHLMMDKIRTALQGRFITPAELKELNELNRYFKENCNY